MINYKSIYHQLNENAFIMKKFFTLLHLGFLFSIGGTFAQSYPALKVANLNKGSYNTVIAEGTNNNASSFIKL